MSGIYLMLFKKCLPFLATVSILSTIGATTLCARADAADVAAPRWGNLQFIGPDTISDIAASSAPAVVNLVANTSVTRARGPVRRDDSNKKLRRYYGMDGSPSNESETLKVTGSGVVVSPNGYILTSLHVVENANSVSVTLQDGRAFDGNIVARDRFSDLALVKVPAVGLQTVKFGNAELLRPGDWVIAIGNQFGLGHTVTHGLVSGIGREAKGFDKSFGARTGAVRFIQTDAPINPGSSGGPLLNLKGEVVGINTFIRDDAQNIGFAIPSNVASEVAEKLARSGSIAHPYIGITMKEPPGAVSATDSGVEIAEVRFQSPAASAGIMPGDLIVQVDSSPAAKPEDVSTAVSKRNIGDNVKIKVRRNGVDKDFDVKVEPLPDDNE